MKSIYLILTRSTSAASRLIGHFTDEPYTHVSIAFEPKSRIMYSFARKYARLPLPAGLVEEHMDGGFYRNQGNIPCAVLRLDVDERTWRRARDRVCDMFVRREEFRYSVLGLLACKMGIPAEIPVTDPGKIAVSAWFNAGRGWLRNVLLIAATVITARLWKGRKR